MNKHRSALRIQLQYIKRNSERIDSRVPSGTYAFSKDQMIEFSTCKEIFRQQTHLWETKTSRLKQGE
ncbi:MAG: hypothetical protein PHW40_00670 [Candidatus Izemoplasmatales bacterium]|nr:hypothetical protein [Candidatus Izemoplasmatales bacterium]